MKQENAHEASKKCTSGRHEDAEDEIKITGGVSSVFAGSPRFRFNFYYHGTSHSND
jgi:hypothetical protein